jgi:energy-coupling factor transporter ATP-binding protein EcfA2
MLTRLEIDNFRCFEGFVWEPARKQLILGANGCGKSSMMDALTNLRRFVAGDAKVDELFPLRERTRWLRQPEQKFSVQATLDKAAYTYTLVVGTTGDPPKPVVELETLACGSGPPLVKFERGYVTLDRAPKFLGTIPLSVMGTYPLDTGRSAISSLGDTKAAALAIRFRRWLSRLYCFRLNPFNMDSRAEGEDADPKLDLSNFAAWFRSLYQSHQKRAYALSKNLEETLDGFDSIVLQDAAEGVRLFNARFTHKDGNPIEFRFNELSEGQRCLICLYTVLHFLVVEGRTVVIDEPESFIGLRELQPWLKTASRMVSEADGQLILISHNPELIDQWAPRHGVRFVRDGMTPVKVEPWHGNPESGLSPAELVARGWDDA